MVVKTTPEIGKYTEAIYFGLSLRQFLFSVLAVGVAILLYFLLRPVFDIETLSWVCVLGAAPFAALGFFTYNGLNAEKFLVVLVRDMILEPRSLDCKTAEEVKRRRFFVHKGD